MALVDFVTQLIGLPTWNIKRGFSTFITLEFGKVNEVVSSENKTIHGEWHLWVEMAAWRFVKDGYLLVGSDDEDPRQAELIEELALHDATVSDARSGDLCPDLTLTFYDGLRFEVFATSSSQTDRQWTLYIPSGEAVIVYGNGRHEVTA